MSDAPFMQLYVADYLGDTLHLTTEQHGAYLLILMAMWRAGGRLPNDPAKLARIARVSARRWHLLAGEVMPFFIVDGDEITQKRLLEERQKAASISAKRSASGKLGGEAKALKNKEPALANAKQMPKHSHIPESEEEKREANASPKKSDLDEFKAELPDLDTERIEAIIKHRRSKRGQITGLAARLFRKDAAACGMSVADAVDTCISRNWITVKPEYLADRHRSQAPPPRLTQGESLRNMAREAGVIDATGNPIRRVDPGDRDREETGFGDVVRFAIAGNHGW